MEFNIKGDKVKKKGGAGRGGNEINLRLDPKESGKLHSGLMKIDAMARSMVEKIIFSVVIEAA